MRNIAIIHDEIVSPSDPRDYRRGILLGSLLVVFGVLVWGVTVVSLITATGHDKYVRIFLGGFVSGLWWAIPGILMIQRSKVGLWLMYVLSAFQAYSFCSAFAKVLGHHNREESYAFILMTIWTALWFSIVLYFHNRKALFTGWWRSDETSNLQGDDAV